MLLLVGCGSDVTSPYIDPNVKPNPYDSHSGDGWQYCELMFKPDLNHSGMGTMYECCNGEIDNFNQCKNWGIVDLKKMQDPRSLQMEDRQIEGKRPSNWKTVPQCAIAIRSICDKKIGE